jgi:hypothetical protein
MSKADIGVVHLVRARNGLAPVQQFLDSYAKFPAGISHELIFVLKGFPGRQLDGKLDALLNRFPHSRIWVGDWGYDVTAYFRAARRLSHPFFCFLNSFSEILADDWLQKLYRAALRPQAGVVGATGSYQGYHEDWKTMPRKGSFPIRPRWKDVILKWPYAESLNSRRLRFLYPFFPNAHLRTNAFMLRREVMLSLKPKITLTKRQAYNFESGKASMTRQILDSGQTAFVVGRDGTVYGIAEWKASNTFWKGEEENLLIADNQTRRYLASDPDSRSVFNWYAWGADRDDEQLRAYCSSVDRVARARHPAKANG